jgi:hypothetical protein
LCFGHVLYRAWQWLTPDSPASKPPYDYQYLEDGRSLDLYEAVCLMRILIIALEGRVCLSMYVRFRHCQRYEHIHVFVTVTYLLLAFVYYSTETAIWGRFHLALFWFHGATNHSKQTWIAYYRNESVCSLHLPSVAGR